MLMVTTFSFLEYTIPTFLVSLIFIRCFIKCAGKFGFVDTPNLRSSHKKTTPSSCGIAFFSAILLASTFTDMNVYHEYGKTIVAIFLILALGALDDLKGLRARYKVFVIAIASILSSWDGLVLTNIGTYFGYTIPLLWTATPLTIISIIAFTNALNLIDGLDGLAGSISIIILGSLFTIGYQNNDLLLIGVTTLIIPALLAFLTYNWNPAKAFMGDSGSLTLGFIISILCIHSLNYVSPIVILYIVAVPIIDTIIVITKRVQQHRPIFSPDKNHIHHVLLNNYNKNIKKTVTAIALIQLAYSCTGIIFVKYLPQEISTPFYLLSILVWYYILTDHYIKHTKLPGLTH